MAGRTVMGATVGTTQPGPVEQVTRGLRTPLGDEGYLWLIVALELIATAILRAKFRAHHGG